MAKNLGTYPLQDQIVDLNTGRMSAAFERTFRDMWTQINGAAKVVGVYVAQGNTITIKANTLKEGSHIDIVAERGQLAAAGNVSVNFGTEQLCAVAYAGVPNCKMVIRVSVVLASGPLGCSSVYSATNSGGGSDANIWSFTMPDLTKDITVTVDLGNSSNLLVVKTYT